jgi:outer membrane protein insertion porin family
LTVLVLILAVKQAAAQDSGKVHDVLVEGNKRVEVPAILQLIKLQPGEEYSSTLLTEDIKSIYRSGFFDNVEGRPTRSSGRLNVIFTVKEKPAIRNITFTGNEAFKEATLKEKLGVSSKFFLDRKKIATGTEEILRAYQSDGYYGATVKTEESFVDDEQVDLNVVINEGSRKKIRQVEFEGVVKVDKDELHDVVKTSTYSWLYSWITGSGVVKKEYLDNDVKEVTKYYLDHGYVDVRVAEPTIRDVEDGLEVVFKVDEGDHYNFGKITASGDLKDDSIAKTLEGVASKPGESFNLDQMRKDTFVVSEKFTDIGYAFANVEPLTSINRNDKTVDINYKVNKGNLIHIDRINISGNNKTADNVIRRTLLVYEQDLFRSSKVRRSQELLQRQGYFDGVTIAPEPSDREDTMNLGVAVKEGNTGTFSIGGGVGSGEGFIFTSKVAESNLFGTGNSLSFDVNTGSRRDNYILAFNNPRLYDTYVSMGIDGFSVRRRYDQFDNKQVGGGVSFGYPLMFLGEDLAQDYRASLSYQLMHIDIVDIEDDAPTLIQDSAGGRVASIITPQLTRNTINNPLDPSNGSRQQASVEFAGLGGDENYWLIQASNSFYRPLWESPIGNFVFANRIKFGQGENWSGDKSFPLFKRFFPGGINSVRGYAANELGPKDENGNEYGGNKQLIANFELIFPLVQSIGLSGVTFYDIGNAFDDDIGISVKGLKQAVGWGIRWRSPLAPIRIEFGYPIDKDSGDKSFVTNFSLGAPL